MCVHWKFGAMVVRDEPRPTTSSRPKVESLTPLKVSMSPGIKPVVYFS